MAEITGFLVTEKRHSPLFLYFGAFCFIMIFILLFISFNPPSSYTAWDYLFVIIVILISGFLTYWSFKRN